MKKLITLALIFYLAFPFSTDANFLGLEEDEIKELEDLTLEFDLLYSEPERRFLYFEVEDPTGERQNLGCDPDIFANLVQLGAEDTVKYAIYPSGSEMTPFVWEDFIDTTRKYIITYETKRLEILKQTREIDPDLVVISTDQKFSKTGILLFEIFLKHYIGKKLNVAIKNHFTNASECSNNAEYEIDSLQKLEGRYLDEDLPALIERLWIKENIILYTSFWHSLTLSMKEVLESVGDELSKTKSLYEKVVSSISALTKYKN